MKQITIGILAHVDAGKTTLSEALLYQSGSLRRLGRVDHQDSFLDTDQQERERGITIFSKEARMDTGSTRLILLDTPGHVDFSAETERVLGVLDYAILVISGTSGVQSHTRTLWKLLAKYQIPVFLFLNKMDISHFSKAQLAQQVQKALSPECILFDQTPEEIEEQAAMASETALEEYTSTGHLSRQRLCGMIASRQIFPCYSGSALKLDGIRELMKGLDEFTLEKSYPAFFGARVYKISYDPSGERLTHLKITGGTLQVKQAPGKDPAEKVDQIRLYSGDHYEMVQQVSAGEVAAVCGLTSTYPGMGLGEESDAAPPVLNSFLNYRVYAKEDPAVLEKALRILEQEEPQLHVVYRPEISELCVQLMGEVQLEVLKRRLKDRFGYEVSFSEGSIVYRETISGSAQGAGHFEPLRHYAEVHLLLEEAPRGSGIHLESRVSTDVLPRATQNLIMTHLSEKVFTGVLTGSPITDMAISLIGGRYSVDHTAGGDFREAVYRAVRQGLLKAHSVLLEPWYDFELEIPRANLGRALTDLDRMQASFEPPVTGEDMTVITGACPVSEMSHYAAVVSEYSKGHGHLSVSAKGYFPCHNTQEVISQIGYDALHDPFNTGDSVFCSHGTSFVVPWYESSNYMHVHPLDGMTAPLEEKEESSQKNEGLLTEEKTVPPQESKTSVSDPFALDKELMAIFEKTYGPAKVPSRKEKSASSDSSGRRSARDAGSRINSPEPVVTYLLVDGYNVIFAWKYLEDLARKDLSLARRYLMDMMAVYQRFRSERCLVVFDAYNVPRPVEDISLYHGVYEVFTKKAETADAYIARTSYELSRKYQIKVVTSDNLEQLIILSHGALRISSREFEEEMKLVLQEARQAAASWNKKEKASLEQNLPLDALSDFSVTAQDHGDHIDQGKDQDKKDQ